MGQPPANELPLQRRFARCARPPGQGCSSARARRAKRRAQRYDPLIYMVWRGSPHCGAPGLPFHMCGPYPAFHTPSCEVPWQRTRPLPQAKAARAQPKQRGSAHAHAAAIKSGIEPKANPCNRQACVVPLFPAPCLGSPLAAGILLPSRATSPIPPCPCHPTNLGIVRLASCAIARPLRDPGRFAPPLPVCHACSPASFAPCLASGRVPRRPGPPPADVPLMAGARRHAIMKHRMRFFLRTAALPICKSKSKGRLRRQMITHVGGSADKHSRDFVASHGQLQRQRQQNSALFPKRRGQWARQGCVHGGVAGRARSGQRQGRRWEAATPATDQAPSMGTISRKDLTVLQLSKA